jgi:hypothetical protein
VPDSTRWRFSADRRKDKRCGIPQGSGRSDSVWLTSTRASQTQQQEERENREAPERFTESQRKKQGGSKTE